MFRTEAFLTLAVTKVKFLKLKKIKIENSAASTCSGNVKLSYAVVDNLSTCYSTEL